MSRTPVIWGLALVLLCSPVAFAAGSQARYALVVGDDFGRTDALELPNLQHAEREARRLRDQLVRQGHFDPERTELVLGGGRKEILAAAGRLAERLAKDRAELGAMPTLFAFFFTGHGLSGQLLTADAPLTGGDLATIFQRMDASLTVGFFDACFAGSLDLDALKAKGVVSTPGFNPIAELPAELLNSEGTLWFVSSRPEELSYEDERLGGLFTHFFTEAFERASKDAIGATLEDMWEYARRSTLAHAARYGRSQTPEKIVRKLKARGPVYFSFSKDRRARLVFDPEVSGTFLLRYEHGALVEKVVKAAGAPLQVAIYEGWLSLSKLDAKGANQNQHTDQRFEVASGDEILIRPRTGDSGASGPGYRQVPIRSKGRLAGLALTRADPEPWFLLGADYRYALVNDRVLGAGHGVSLGGWMARGPLSLGLGISYARRSEDYETWSLDLDEFGAEASVGVGFDLAGTRLDLEVAGRVGAAWAAYGSGEARHPVAGWLGGGLRFWLPLPLGDPWIVLQARLLLGARVGEGLSAQDDALYWTLEPVFQVGLLVPLSGG